jgi:hypothetical protein
MPCSPSLPCACQSQLAPLDRNGLTARCWRAHAAPPAHVPGRSTGLPRLLFVAISHREKDDAVTLDLLFERKAPFNPSEVTEEISTLLKSYGCSQVTGDKYAAQWVVEAFQKVGIKYIQSERDRSAIYLDCLPLFTSGRARLIDSARLVAQFAALERRTFSNGRDKVDHGRETSARDDACNSAAGALVLAAGTGGFDSSYLWVGGPSGGEAQPFGRPANNPFAGMYFFDH